MNTINGKVYFISDAHLGVPDFSSSLEREKKLVKWLCQIEKDADYLILLGDIFDFWFEYKSVIPRGYTRLMGKLAELSDKGIQIYFFTGNHDMWVRDYFKKELGIKVLNKPETFLINGLKTFVGHGDGLGPRDIGYKILKRIFECKTNQWLFARLHPNFSFWLAQYLSRKSRAANASNDEIYHGDNKEFLILFIKETIKKENFDYFIFGHRHLALEMEIDKQTKYINTGDWIRIFSYAETVDNGIRLKCFKD